MPETLVIKSRIDNIELDIFKPENWDEKKIVLLCHGFNSGKGSESYAIIGNILLEKGIAFARFTLPYHAERRTDYNDFTLENCVEDSELAEKALREKFPNTKIGILGTSFGGYLTLLRLYRYKHDYFAIILKSPAIKMGEIFRSFITDEEFEQYKNQGYIINGYDENGMKISYNFYEELMQNLVENYDFDDEILLYHGMIDDTAPYEDSLDFANKNKNTILHSLQNENHKFSMEVLLKFSEEIADYCAKRG